MKQLQKQFFSLLLCTVMVFNILPTKVLAATEYTYVDENGIINSVVATVIDSSTTTLSSGWYVVNSNVSTGTINVSGNAKLILADGATLTVTGTTKKAGIYVAGSNSLTVYGQINGTGILDVTAGSSSAGIGTGYEDVNDAGTVNIYGGTVIAKGTGVYGGAGIGGGKDGMGGTVNIYEGTVTAVGNDGGAGIGGGYFGSGGSVNIYGGMVTATGGAYGAGIGGGYLGSGSSVNIYGGMITATGGANGTGIGGGYNGSGGSCVITGGTVKTSSMGCIPTNGSTNGTTKVYLTTVTLNDVSTSTKITSLITSAGYYGINSLYTDSSGTLYLWLPEDATVTAVTTAAGDNYRGTVTSNSGGTTSGSFICNDAPTDITLSSSTISENIASGSICGILSTTDVSSEDSFTYSLVSGDGDTDNSAFLISGQELKLNAIPDYETKNSYHIRIRSTDAGGLYYEKAFTISITNVNDTPTITAPISYSTYADSTIGITGISFADQDVGSASVTSRFSVTSGILTATSSGGVLVTGSGTSDITLTGGISDINAFLGGDLLTFTSEPDVDTPVTLTIRINDNGNTGSGGPQMASDTIDITMPPLAKVTSVFASVNGSYKAGDSIDFLVNFSKSVTVDTSGGTPYIPLTVGSSTVKAYYQSGSGTTTLFFRYTVGVGDNDSDGVTIGSSINLNNGVIQSDNMNAVLNLNSIQSTSGILVDTTATTIASVTPANNAINVPVSGTITISFKEAMSSQAGIITLMKSDGSLVTTDAANGNWTDSRNYTISYTGLSYSTDYTVNISGFQDIAGNEMVLDTGHSFTTEEEPLTPSVTPTNLTVYKNETTTLTLTFGKGVTAATGASITLDNNSITSVNTVQATTPGAITVTGLAVGTTNMTIVFNDSSNTTETVTVIVLPTIPSWPSGSTLEASNITSESATLTWTDAQDITEVTGYKLYQNGVLIATVNGTTTSYAVSGLTASTVYSFKVQAGNVDDICTTEGPSIQVTTSNPSTSGSSITNGQPDSTQNITQTAKKLNDPIIAEYNVKPSVNKKGLATITVSETDITNAISRAKADAKAQERTADGIGVAVNIDLPDKATSLQIILPQQVLKSLIDAGVKQFKINGKLINIDYDLISLREIQKQSTSNVTISITKATGLSKNAKNLIGTRPVYNVTLRTIKEGKTVRISNLNGGRATLAIPYKVSNKESESYLFAVYVDDSGKPQRIAGSIYDVNSGHIIFATNHFSVYGVGYQASSAKFTDIIGHWAKDSIEYVVGRGLLTGISDTSFSPDIAITRGMLATALARLAEVDGKDYTTSSFLDVKIGDSYQPYIEWAYKKGIIQGTGDNRFNPYEAVTREELAAIIMNYAKATGYTLPVTREMITYKDNNSISSIYKEAVTTIQQAGIMMGENNNQFNPKEKATRAEVSAILYRYIKLTIDATTAQGWAINDSGQWMYYKDGKALTGWQTIGENNKRYYFTDNAIMLTGGWEQMEDKWYYFYTDGSLAVNTKIDGVEVDENGVRKTT